MAGAERRAGAPGHRTKRRSKTRRSRSGRGTAGWLAPCCLAAGLRLCLVALAAHGGQVSVAGAQALQETGAADDSLSPVLLARGSQQQVHQLAVFAAAAAAAETNTEPGDTESGAGAAALSAPEAAAARAVNYAELCYLSNGGSSLTLTVNEATQVGSVVGTVEVNGDPSFESGNVDLSMASQSSADSGAGVANSAPGTRSHPIERRSSGPAPAPAPAQLSSFYSIVGGSSQPAPAQQPQVGASLPAPIRLEPGTKNLVLARRLDKESADGEQSQLLQVRCAARAGSPADSSSIPVRLIVTDANDHAPEFVNTPYVVNVSEIAPPGTVVARDILAVDRDSAGPFSTIHYRVQEEAPLLQFLNPLDPTLVVAGQLDYETLGSFTLTLVAQDQDEQEPLSSSVQLQVNVIDYDDQNPRFLDDKYTLLMDESQQTLVGQNLQVLPRNLYAEDGDRGINAPILYSFDQLGGFQRPGEPLAPGLAPEAGAEPAEPAELSIELAIEHYLHLNPSSGEIRLIRQWPSRWTGAPLTLVVRATQADNKDRYSLTTLTISRGSLPALVGQPAAPAPGAGAAPAGIQFVPDRLNVSLAESVPINEKVARVRARYLATSSDQGSPEAGEAAGRQQQRGSAKRPPIIYQILDDQGEQFGINGLGEILVKRPLDYEQRQSYRFRVLATYTKYSDICQVQVNVLNVNDNKPKFSQSHYLFHLSESKLRNNLIGTVQASDADLNDTIQYSLSQAADSSHLFQISPTGGQISLRLGAAAREPALRLDSAEYQLVVLASDSLGPAKNTQQALVQVQVAQALLGQPLFAQAGSHASSQADGRSFNSRSLLQERPELARARPQGSASGGGGGGGQHREHQPTRSSLATLVASVQHMAHGAGFLDMPWSSALLLAGLLGFLLLLLLVLIVSMSLHLYRRRDKLRRRQQAAASHLRAAQLSAGPGAPGSPQPPPACSLSYLGTPSPGSASRPAGRAPPPSASHQSAPAARQAQLEQQQHFLAAGSLQARHADAALGARSQVQQLHLNLIEDSLVSSISSQSKRSYLSNSTDDSSVIHCGHYSVNSPPQDSALQRSVGAAPPLAAAAAGFLSSCEPQPAASQKSRGGGGGGGGELAALTGAGQPGCRAYRKLPHLGSLIRPSRGARVAPEPELECAGGDSVAHAAASDSAIASDGGSSSAGQESGALAASMRQQQASAKGAASQQLGRLVEQLGARDPPSPAPSSSPVCWPASPAQRAKRLTWDDELEADAECYLAPDVRLSGLVSPLEGQHQYRAPLPSLAGPEAGASEDQYSEQHFLFSNQCSPSSPALCAAPAGADQKRAHNRDNCLDYTFVQSSHMKLEALISQQLQLQQQQQAAAHPQFHKPGLSVQQQLLIQQKCPNYLYAASGHSSGRSSRSGRRNSGSDLGQLAHSGAPIGAARNRQDLTQMTTAVL